MEANYSYIKKSDEDFGCPICFDNLSPDLFKGEVNEITQKVHKTACGKFMHTGCAQECWKMAPRCPTCNDNTYSFDQECDMWVNELFAQRINAEEEKVSNERKAVCDADEEFARKLQADFDQGSKESIVPIQKEEQVSKKRKVDYDADEEFARKLQADFDSEAQKPSSIEPEKKKPRHEEVTLPKVSGKGDPGKSRDEVVGILIKAIHCLENCPRTGVIEQKLKFCYKGFEILCSQSTSDASFDGADIYYLRDTLFTCYLNEGITRGEYDRANVFLSGIGNKGIAEKPELVGEEKLPEKLASQGVSKQVQQGNKNISRHELIEILKKGKSTLSNCTFLERLSYHRLIDRLIDIDSTRCPLSPANISLIREMLEKCLSAGTITDKQYRQATECLSEAEKNNGLLN